LIAVEERRREGVPKRVIIHGQAPPNQDNKNNGDSNGRLIILPDSIQLLFDLAGQFHSYDVTSLYLYIESFLKFNILYIELIKLWWMQRRSWGNEEARLQWQMVHMLNKLMLFEKTIIYIFS